MNKIIAITSIFLLVSLVALSSAYMCIEKEDNREVQEFKTNVNLAALQVDRDNGLTDEQILTKIKYFNPCN